MNILDFYRNQDGQKDLSDILMVGSKEHPYGLPDHFLEKDIWVTHILHLLFERELLNGYAVAFKGGTALSKCWGAIDRFSEDIDLSIHWADLAGINREDEQEAWIETTCTRNQNDKFRKAQTERLIAWSGGLVTELNKIFSDYGIPDLKATLDEGASGEKVQIQYPKAASTSGKYHLDYVLLEFGGRNRGEPTSEHEVKTYLSTIEAFKGLEFPSARANVFDISYIVWEKLTAIHQFSTMTREPPPHRLARHWYDVYNILQRDIVDPMKSINAMHDVIEMKKLRWREKGVDYEEIMKSGAKFIPDEDRLEAIKKDHQSAIDGRMFFGNTEPENFDTIVERILLLQDEINSSPDLSLSSVSSNKHKNYLSF